MTAYVFDVDGTLTPSRGLIDPVFGAWFMEFARNNSVYLVTGSDREKTLEQLTEPVYNVCQAAYQCSGNDVWQDGNRVRLNDWELHDEAVHWLLIQLKKNNWKQKTGNHLETRPGMLNFSILGRNAAPHQREAYVAHDIATGERARISDEFNKLFNKDGVQSQVGGETGLDIMQLGAGKEQILTDFLDSTPIHFFGDRTMPGGNDHGIAQAVMKRNRGFVYSVNTWQDTWEKLKGLS